MSEPRKVSERELEHRQEQVTEQSGELRVFIADILPRECCQRQDMDDRMRELENLVTSYGGVVILEHLQKRGIPDYNTYIGGGKLDEIAAEMQLQDVHLLILGNILKPHQIYNINQKLKTAGIVAWDRVDLILKIFQKNAKTTESRLQIELAAIKHMGPRIFGMGMEMSRQGGGSKLARGKGETNTEIMKRHLAKREIEIKKDLEKYTKVRENHRQGRKKKGLLTVGIVGYTNAGKSSLLNALTSKGVLAENKLFATLGTSVGKMWIAPKASSTSVIPVPSRGINLAGINKIDNVSLYLDRFLPSQEGHIIQEGNNDRESYAYQKGIEILLSDTIGFIRDLPPELVDAFASTLEDSIESDILFHVVDSSDPKIDEKIQIVDGILERIGAKQQKIYVFNKIDMLSKKALGELKKRHKDKKTLFVSTYEKTGFESVEKYLSGIVTLHNSQ